MHPLQFLRIVGSKAKRPRICLWKANIKPQNINICLSSFVFSELPIFFVKKYFNCELNSCLQGKWPPRLSCNYCKLLHKNPFLLRSSTTAKTRPKETKHLTRQPLNPQCWPLKDHPQARPAQLLHLQIMPTLIQLIHLRQRYLTQSIQNSSGSF